MFFVLIHQASFLMNTCSYKKDHKVIQNIYILKISLFPFIKLDHQKLDHNNHHLSLSMHVIPLENLVHQVRII